MKLILTESEFKLVDGVKGGIRKFDRQMQALEKLGYDIDEKTYSKRNLVFLLSAIAEFDDFEVYIKRSDGSDVKATVGYDGEIWLK